MTGKLTPFAASRVRSRPSLEKKTFDLPSHGYGTDESKREQWNNGGGGRGGGGGVAS